MTDAAPHWGATTAGRTGAVDDHRVTAPWLLRAAAGWSWRIIAVGIAVALLVRLLVELRVLVLSLAGGLLLTALIAPLHRRLLGLGMRRALAAVVTLLILLLGIAAVLAFLSSSTVAQWPQLQASLGTGLGQVRDWLADGPLGVDRAQLDRLQQQAVDQINANRSSLASGALTGATLLVEVLGGAVLALFATFFFLFDGPSIWGWVVRLFVPPVRERVDGAGAVAWQTLTGYIRGTILVALVDAVFIGLGLFVVGVPLVAPLAVLTFLGAFIPVVGALLTGIAAVLVALVANGPVAALIILGVVLLVQQVEGHILQPLVLGKSVQLHPLAIVFAITTGATLAGIPGAIIAVPILAVLNRVTVYLLRLRHTEHSAESAVQAERSGPLADEPTPEPDAARS